MLSPFLPQSACDNVTIQPIQEKTQITQIPQKKSTD